MLQKLLDREKLSKDAEITELRKLFTAEQSKAIVAVREAESNLVLGSLSKEQVKRLEIVCQQKEQAIAELNKRLDQSTKEVNKNE